jgi:hypothetical protein
MVGADKLALETSAGFAIDNVTIDLTVAIDHTVRPRRFVTLLGPFTREVFVLSMNVEGMRLLLYSTQFATQIFVIHP